MAPPGAGVREGPASSRRGLRVRVSDVRMVGRSRAGGILALAVANDNAAMNGHSRVVGAAPEAASPRPELGS